MEKNDSRDKLYENALYYVNYKLLIECNEDSWDKLFFEKIDSYGFFDLNENMALNEVKEDFIIKNKLES